MNRLGSLLCPIIVGRDDLLDLADRRLAEVAAGRGQMLLIAGQAGIGKSRLLSSIRNKARAAGFGDANGSVAPQDRNLPSALIDDFARTIRHQPGFESLGDDILSMRSSDRADALGSRRIYVLDVVDRVIAAIDRPMMITFEDLQWSDEISLEIVGELARRAHEVPLLIAACYRLEELAPGSFFREWRARLIAQRLAEELRLAPLTYEQTALMTTLILATGLPAPREVVAAVHERTDGIPLHIEELIGALPEDARSDGRRIRDAVVPDTIEDAILARLDQLSPDARAVAGAGAVIGRCFIPEVLAGIMDRPVAELDGPIAELVDQNYLYDAGDPGWIDFRHQLLRDVLYRTVAPTELRRLHARAAEFGTVLDGQSEVHSSVHYERAGLRAEAFRAARAGAERASRMSGRQEAYELYRRAIANMPADLPALEQAKLYAAYSSAAGAIEHNREAIEAAERARAAYLAAGHDREATELLLDLAMMPAREGHPVGERLAAINAAWPAIERLPAGRERDALAAAFYDNRAFLELDASMLDEATADVRRAIELAETLGERDTVLNATITLARIDVIAGRLETGFRSGLRAAREARDAGYEGVGVTGLRNLAIAAARVLDYRTAEEAIREGLRYADAIEQSHCRQQMAATSALMAWSAGQWDVADATARQELAERGCRRGEVGAIDVLGLVAMGRGDVDEARRWSGESLAAAERMGEVAYRLPALWALAEIDLIAGDPAGSFARCRDAFEIASAAGERALLVPFVVTGTRAALAEARPDLAERWLADSRAFLAGWEPVAGAALSHAAGLVGLATGSIAAARDALEVAIRGWEDRGRAWEASWARLDLAHALLRSNRYGEAASLLAAVRATGEGIGSGPLVRRADELARIGRGRGTSEEPWRPLTAREFEVARLIADGLTNQEIADQLAIAPKTASSHVEHILTKLGVGRRAEIAAWTASIVRPDAQASEPARRQDRVVVVARR